MASVAGVQDHHIGQPVNDKDRPFDRSAADGDETVGYATQLAQLAREHRPDIRIVLYANWLGRAATYMSTTSRNDV